MRCKRFIQNILVLTCLLIAVPSVQAALVSDFDDGTMQGWSEGDPFNNGSLGGTLSVVNSGGNPGGYLRATDSVADGGSLAALAPTLLSGNLTLLGGLLWDVLLPSQAVCSTNVLLEGTDGTFYRSEYTLLETNSWFTKSVDFGSDVGWQLLKGTASFASVVSNTKALYIELDVTTCCTIEAGIDNIRTVSSCSCVDSDNDGVIDQWDTCPDTPANSWVNKNGCPASGLYTEEQMNQMVQAILAWGDINDDGKIGLAEAIRALRTTSGVTKP